MAFEDPFKILLVMADQVVFMRTFRETDPLKSQYINNFCRIDISQPMPSVSLSVSLFSLEEI